MKLDTKIDMSQNFINSSLISLLSTKKKLGIIHVARAQNFPKN